MKKISLLVVLACVFVCVSCDKKREGKPRVLVFSKYAGFKHGSIPTGIAVIQKLGMENNFDVDTTRNAETFNEDSLKKYSAIIFLNTTGDIFDYRQEAAFERYIQSGGGFVGVHSATDTEYDWGWYGRLVGGYLNGHSSQLEANLIIQDRNFPATKFFTDTLWKQKDEFYNFRKLNPDIHVLMTIDESSYEGGTNGSFHPMSWYHEYDGGRAFYTALGHIEEIYAKDNYLKHLLGGIQYAIGDNHELDYSRAKSQLPPDEDRFTKKQLFQGTEISEPTEMTVLPNLDVLIVQRRGEIVLYKNETKKVKQVGYLEVYYKSLSGGNVEEGLLGLAKDPDYENNHWVYLYYSPADSSVNRLSRFTFENDTLDRSTEKVILEIKSMREICCHTGGSIAFGPDGLLYLSTGDNSTPFSEPGQKYANHGFAPLNDDPGHEQYDARRTASNTNDLRGKIIRIKMNEDGTYEIPEGNLFPQGTDKTRPEIYVMGNRNPYRISVDPKNSYLYWGDVGPDARMDSFATRGPRGHDEINQARKAGYFGWPLFVGNNFPYRQYNYTTGKSGLAFDPKKPINDSRNNTGLRDLPPANPAFIWYPYDASPDFPQVGTGGRTAMAGPVYYTDMFPKETRLPDYYHGKVIVYEWIRGWIKAVTLLPNGDFDKMEPFFPAIKTNSLIDMEVGPDGRLYLLEYGTGWFTRNPDTGLSRIDFNAGNMPPKITALKVNRTSGNLPFSIKASVSVMDIEKDKITYLWNLGNGTTKETSIPELNYTYTTIGDFQISVEAIDFHRASTKSNAVNIYSGNTFPKVTIQLTGGNKSFYLPGYPLNYSVTVSDEEDDSKLDPSRLFVSVDYVEGFDKASASLGHQQEVSGKMLTLSLDCKSCHKENEKSIGPSFMAVSQKYKGDANAVGYLTKKIISGGSGVWGEVAMPPHAALPPNDIQQIIAWITSLANSTTLKKSLPPSGTITPPVNQKGNSILILSASYTDLGGNNIKALTGMNQVSLPGNTVYFNGKEPVQEFQHSMYHGILYMELPETEGWFAINNTDLTGVKSINMAIDWLDAPAFGLDFEVRLDAPDGKLLGKGSLPAPQKNQTTGIVRVMLEPTKDNQLHQLFFIHKPKRQKDKMVAGVSMLEFNAK